MPRYFLLSVIVAFQLNTQAQTSSKCFTDFNLYKNEGIGVLKNCHAHYFVKHFTNAGKIYKLIPSNVFGDQNDYIKTYQNEDIKVRSSDSLICIFSQSLKMPLEGKLFGTANDNRFDTLLSKMIRFISKKLTPILFSFQNISD